MLCANVGPGACVFAQHSLSVRALQLCLLKPLRLWQPARSMDHIDLPPLLSFENDDGGGHGEPPPRLLGETSAIPHPNAQGAAAVVQQGGGGRVAQLDLPAPLAIEGDMPREVARSRFPDMRDRAAYARAALAAQRATKQLKVAQEKETNARSDLALAKPLRPSVGRLLGGDKGSKRVLNKATAKPMQDCAMALAVFFSGRQQINLGVKRKRLTAATAGLVCDRQARGLARLATNATGGRR